MSKVGGGGLLVAGIFLVFLGFLIRSSLLEWLLDVFGLVVIVGGAVVGIIGLIQMFTGGGRSSSSDY